MWAPTQNSPDGGDDNKSLRLGGNQQFPMENAQLRVHKSVENVHFR